MTIDLKRIKAERIAKGFTQDEMAEKLGGKLGHHMLSGKMVWLE